MIRIIQAADASDFLQRARRRDEKVEAVVRQIIEDVRREGDTAVLRYARKLDGLADASLLVGEAELANAAGSLPPSLQKAIAEASANIRAVALMQLPRPWQIELAPGHQVGQIVRPLSSIAAYVPSGRYPLVSTLLMTVIPAQVAGVPHIAIASPHPGRDVLGAASLLGQQIIYRLGGAHAIAALALGTQTIPRVDRIVGPGNAYVAEAKRQLAGEVAIDFVAGPTEIVIIAREGNARWIAADMLAQAEHDSDASAILFTPAKDLAQSVAQEIDLQLKTLPTAAVAGVAMERNSAIIVVDSLDQAIDLTNRFAPEHLSVDSEDLVQTIENAGSLFVGPHAPEAAGDYATGSNHVLPTSGHARSRGGLSAADFVKMISIQTLTPEALERLVPTITSLARVEGLEAHARSVEARTS